VLAGLNDQNASLFSIRPVINYAHARALSGKTQKQNICPRALIYAALGD
jgi:hypothetical protein